MDADEIDLLFELEVAHAETPREVEAAVEAYLYRLAVCLGQAPGQLPKTGMPC